MADDRTPDSKLPWDQNYREFWAENYERAAEIARREQHLRELRIARDVQQQLFPQHHPTVAGLEYAGTCRPALEVGGDYYDFVRISENEMGVAIGDVSGKGMPASLLMATLRAYLHGHTAAGQCDLPSLMARLNRFIYECSEPNRYATFFYAHYDAPARSLTYANAGHNSPLLFRAVDERGDTAAVRLEAGGPVIGLLPDCVYAQEHVKLRPGDLLVAFTDGITEAVNNAGEEFGEKRLAEAIRPHRAATAATVVAEILTTVDEFVGEKSQADDMTVVVVRALST